jgi:recombination protein RecT
MGNDLSTRVAGNVARQSGQPGATVAQLIERQRGEIARALPKHMDADRIARMALTLFRQTPGLARCDPQSFIGALMTASQLGLEPGPLGEAYLVPYGNQVTFIPGYRGLIKLAWQSGQLKHIDAQVVREGDDFDFAYGLEPYLRHRPARRGRGKVTEVYACATFLNGGSAFVVMSVEDVEVIRKRSRASKNGPWVTDWDAMAKKTAIKQLIRFLPLSTDLRNLAHAAAMDGTARVDTGELDEAMPTIIDIDDDDQAGQERPLVEEVGEPAPADGAAAEPQRQVRTVNIAEQPAEPAPVAEPQRPAERPAPDLQTEFPPVAGQGDDEPCATGQRTAMTKLLAKGGITTDADALAVLARIAGRTATVEHLERLTAREARQVIEHLDGWQRGSVLADQLAAVLAAPQPGQAADLPAAGSKAWHEQGHPVEQGGRLVTVEALLNGDCGICEQDGAGG